MNLSEIRKRFLDFFKNRNHSILESAPLVVHDSQTVTGVTLFNTAGVQPLVPYLLGKTHPKGVRLASSQKCIRTIDIDSVGDNSHLTFFEMLGNWSLGDYFKKEAIAWSFEFLTSKKEGLGLDPNRIYVTVFEGDDDAPRDTEAYNIWKELIPENRIFFMDKNSNWWEAGENGPCGPDTEMHYDITGQLGDLDKESFINASKNEEIIEIWNDVFMQFEKKNNQIVGKLPKPSVDTGAGLERLATVINGYKNVYETDVFKDSIEIIKKESKNFDMRSARIIIDHIKASIFIISEGINPSNSEHGYVLRRLLRKASVVSDRIGFSNLQIIIDSICDKYSEIYPELNQKDKIKNVISDESHRFQKTISKGLKQFEKMTADKISGEDAFILFSTYGFPIELTLDLAKEKNIEVDLDEFKKRMQDHQEKSRTAAEGKFKGGLQNRGEIETRYHTATHLLHQALRDVLGQHVQQKGSNINSERLRFDFSHDKKVTAQEQKQIEKIINQKILESLPVNQINMKYDEAIKTGALHFFADKYGDIVSIYYIGDNLEKSYSKEFCGGPHIKNTRELGKFKIIKEEACSSGIRRIKAVLE